LSFKTFLDLKHLHGPLIMSRCAWLFRHLSRTLASVGDKHEDSNVCDDACRWRIWHFCHQSVTHLIIPTLLTTPIDDDMIILTSVGDVPDNSDVCDDACRWLLRSWSSVVCSSMTSFCSDCFALWTSLYLMFSSL
jgi:hypothetical protein